MAGIFDGAALRNSPPSFQQSAKSAAEIGETKSISGGIQNTFASGAFNVGGGNPLNIGIIVGALALVTIVFLKRRG